MDRRNRRPRRSDSREVQRPEREKNEATKRYDDLMKASQSQEEKELSLLKTLKSNLVARAKEKMEQTLIEEKTLPRQKDVAVVAGRVELKAKEVTAQEPDLERKGKEVCGASSVEKARKPQLEKRRDNRSSSSSSSSSEGSGSDESSSDDDDRDRKQEARARDKGDKETGRRVVGEPGNVPEKTRQIETKVADIRAIEKAVEVPKRKEEAKRHTPEAPKKAVPELLDKREAKPKKPEKQTGRSRSRSGSSHG